MLTYTLTRHIATAATVLFSLALTTSQAQSLADYAIDQTTGYRMQRYRSPVPADLPGAITIDTAAAYALHNEGAAVFIDVYPPRGLGPDPLDGHWITSDIRESLPGSVWLPEVGRGHLQADELNYFQRNLERLTDSDQAASVVFFCTADCWQSWNAAKRATALGYLNVHWYPLGSDGWAEEGHSLQRIEPVNFIDASLPGLAHSDTASGSESVTGGQAGDADSGDPATAFRFADSANVFLVDQSGKETPIGKISFSTDTSESAEFVFDLDAGLFEDHFLSMRPFRCLTESSEWFCYLPYPYEISRSVSKDNLTDLEYQLLFIWKSPKTFGIDAWNGVYYQLTAQEDGQIRGELLQGDLNVLANPPEPMSYPIDLSEFTKEDSDKRRFPEIVIRP